MRLEFANNVPDLAVDSKCDRCEVVQLRVSDICVADQVKEHASILQNKTKQPVQLEITVRTRNSFTARINEPIYMTMDIIAAQ